MTYAYMKELYSPDKNQARTAQAEGVILAAGWSARTAPACKLAFMMDGRTMLEKSIESMLPFCARVFVVTGAHARTVEGILRGRSGIALVYNPDFASGMYGSVKLGLRRTGAEKVFLLPGDCPFVPPEVYAALLAAQGDIRVPAWQGRAGHPVLLGRRAVGEILRDKACLSLHAFIQAHHPTRVALDCPGILQDIDTMEGYLQALGRTQETMRGGE